MVAVGGVGTPCPGFPLSWCPGVLVSQCPGVPVSNNLGGLRNAQF